MNINDSGPICKHEVAVYFKLEEILNKENKEAKPQKKSSKNINIYVLNKKMHQP